jgi:hypothetical protein
MALPLSLLKQEFDEDGVLLYYKGVVTQENLHALAKSLEQGMLDIQENANAAFKVFGVFVEQVENVIRYAAPTGDESDLQEAIVAVGLEENRYYVSCGNLIKTVNAAGLQSKLDKILTMDKDQLKQFYKEERKRKKADPEAIGAGLGLIEMARKSAKKLEYEMSECENSRSFFAMTVYI